ncbi:MAG: amidohydrolase family protein [Ilumatobacteraceae bacterium]
MAHEVVVRRHDRRRHGAPAYTGDVAIDDGCIAAVGGTLDGRRVIDAAGAVVAPGWVDVHTHFDGQVTGRPARPVVLERRHSLVMGNCGVGFAPCPPGGEQTLIELMEGVEDIPGTALYEGVPWGRWTSFPSTSTSSPPASTRMDVGAQVPHGALRYGRWASAGATTTPRPTTSPRCAVWWPRPSLRARFGVSTSRTIFHRSIDGTAVPGTYANNDELMALAAGIVDGGGAVFEAITSSSIGAMEGLGGERFSQQHELHLLDLIARTTGRPVTFTTTQSRDYPEAWREVLAFAEAQNATGSHLYPQVASRPIGIMSTLAGYHPFMRRRAYLDLAHLPTAERALAMSEPTMKQAILHGDDVPPAQMGSMEALYLALQMATPIMFALDEVVDYEPGPERSFAALAAAAGVTPLERMYDFVCEGDGTNVAALLGAGYVHGNLDAMREMLTSPVTVTGLADAGAHVKLICDGSAPSTQLTLWTRDRTRGDTIPLEFVVEKQTRRSARLYGLHDRGTLEVGMRADVNVIDLDRLSVRRPVGHDDLPAGGFRFLQPVQGTSPRS